MARRVIGAVVLAAVVAIGVGKVRPAILADCEGWWGVLNPICWI